MPSVELVVGLLLGSVGALLHLAVTRRRASLAVSGRPGLALALLPVGFLGPLGAVLLSLSLSKTALLASAASLVGTHLLLLAWLQCRVGGAGQPGSSELEGEP